MKKKKGRFSRFLNPIIFTSDILIINGLTFYFIKDFNTTLLLSAFLSISWIIISSFTQFYRVYRFTPEIKIFRLTLIQYIVFTFCLFAILGILNSFSFKTDQLNIRTVLKLSTTMLLCITIFKFSVYYLLLRFRVVFGGNYRKTIIIGSGNQTNFLANYFNQKKEAGFSNLKVFELLLSFFRENNHKTFNYKQVSSALKIKDLGVKIQIVDVMKEMKNSGILNEVKTGAYTLIEEKKTLFATIKNSNNAGCFAKTEDEKEIFIAKENSLFVLKGDEVELRLFQKRKKGFLGKVVKVLKRKKTSFKVSSIFKVSR